MSFLNPEPPPKLLLAAAGLSTVGAALIILDRLHLIDLPGFGTAMILSLSAVAVSVQFWLRRREREAGRG